MEISDVLLSYRGTTRPCLPHWNYMLGVQAAKVNGKRSPTELYTAPAFFCAEHKTSTYSLALCRDKMLPGITLQVEYFTSERITRFKIAPTIWSAEGLFRPL
jgi:hypothetical protein